MPVKHCLTRGSRFSRKRSISYRSGPLDEPQDLQCDGEITLHATIHQAKTIDQQQEQAHSILSHWASGAVPLMTRSICRRGMVSHFCLVGVWSLYLIKIMSYRRLLQRHMRYLQIVYPAVFAGQFCKSTKCGGEWEFSGQLLGAGSEEWAAPSSPPCGERAA